MKLHKVTSTSRGRYDEFDEPDADSEETRSPVVINATAIKSFYPRKFGRVGTRINFQIGNGFAVSERFEEVQAFLEQLDGRLVGAHASAEVVKLTTEQ